MATYSYSKLSCFDSCPLKYRYKYVDRIRVEGFDTVEAFMGRHVHQAIQSIYAEVKASGAAPGKDEVLAEFNARWHAEWHDDILVVGAETSADDYRRAGRECIAAYYERHAPFDREETIGIEQKVFLNLPNGASLIGFVDRLARRNDGVYEIHDFKTGRCEDEGHVRQLCIYQLALQSSLTDAAGFELVLHYLQSGQETRARVTSEQLQTTQSRVTSTIKVIESAAAAGEFPARPGPLCRWCEYREQCPAATT